MPGSKDLLTQFGTHHWRVLGRGLTLMFRFLWLLQLSSIVYYSDGLRNDKFPGTAVSDFCKKKESLKRDLELHYHFKCKCHLF